MAMKYAQLDQGQYILIDSFLHRLDPRSKMLGLALLSVAVAAASYPLGLVCLAFFVLALAWQSQIGFRAYWQGYRPFLWIIIITLILQWIVGASLYPAAEALAAVAALAIRLTVIVLAALVLTFSTAPAALTHGLERILSPLARTGLPVGELVIIISLALRFLPILVEETEQIRMAQIGRGAASVGFNIKKRLQNALSLVVPLLRLSLQRAIDIGEAMESRAYAAGQARTRMRPLSMGKGDYQYISIHVLVLCLAWLL